MKLSVIKIIGLSCLLSSTLSANIYQNLILNISNFSSETEEIVYSPTDGRKLSELTWVADDVKMLGIGYSVNLYDYFTLNLNYKRNLDSGEGQMDDYDWLDSNTPNAWTHWSTHPNTDIELVEHIDLNLGKSIFDNGSAQVNLFLGYKDEKTKFIAYDGTGIYNNVPVVFSGKGITYQHNITMPYVKLEYKYTDQDYKLFAALSYSPFVTIEDYDTHHLRDLQFDSSFENSTYKGINAGLTYQYNKSIAFNLEYNKAIYDEAKGITKRTDLTDDSTITYGGAGFSQTYNLLTFNVNKTF